MKQIATILMYILVSLFSPAKAQPDIKCKTYEDYVKADPENDIATYFTYDSKSKVYFLLANNDKNLYLKVIITDEIVQKKILAFGNNLWINTDGSKKHRLGIQFPVQDAKKTPQPPRGRKDDFTEKKFDIASQLNTARLVGFPGKKSDTMVDIQSVDELKIKLFFTKLGTLVQEYEIPFTEIKADFNPFTNNDLSLGMVTGYLTIQMQPQSDPGNGQIPPPDRERSSEMEEITYPTELWIKNIKLVTQ